MAEMTYQVAVIGGGPCLNRGCIPTKTFLKTADMIRDIHKAVQHGVINDPATSVDMEKVVANKDHVVRQLTGGVGALLRSNGVTVVKGEAALSADCLRHAIAAVAGGLFGGALCLNRRAAKRKKRGRRR